jgi:type IV pilus assembly protein PilW
MNRSKFVYPTMERRAARGFTLIELLVALFVGLFLLAGLFTIEFGMRRTTNNQGVLGQLEDNERLAMTLISQVVQSTGYISDPTVTGSAPQVAFTGAAPFSNPGQAISGATDGSGNDNISVVFNTQSGDPNINCLGGTNTSGGGQTPLNTLSIQLSGNASANGGYLQCQLNGGAQIPLVTGIQGMHVWYGVVTNAALVLTAPSATAPNTCGTLPNIQSTAWNNVDTYIATASMTPQNWCNVTSALIELVFTNPLYQPVAGGPVTPGQNPTVTFEWIVDLMSRAGTNL